MTPHRLRSSHLHPACKLLAGIVLLILVLATALAPAALGRAAMARHSSSCKSSRHARRSSHAARCGKHRKAGSKHNKGSTPNAAAKPLAHNTAARVPLRCEDGTLPAQEAPNEFACDDESTPSCPDGSSPQLSADGTTLTCPAATSNEAAQETVQTEVCEVSGEEDAAACALTEEEES